MSTMTLIENPQMAWAAGCGFASAMIGCIELPGARSLEGQFFIHLAIFIGWLVGSMSTTLAFANCIPQAKGKHVVLIMAGWLAALCGGFFIGREIPRVVFASVSLVQFVAFSAIAGIIGGSTMAGYA